MMKMLGLKQQEIQELKPKVQKILEQILNQQILLKKATFLLKNLKQEKNKKVLNLHNLQILRKPQFHLIIQVLHRAVSNLKKIIHKVLKEKT